MGAISAPTAGIREHADSRIARFNGTAKPYFADAGQIAGDRHGLKRRFQA